VRLSDRDGRSFFTWFMRDVTERNQAEQARRIIEARLRRAIEANSDGLWEWNIRTNEEFFSSRWWEIIGYSDADPELPHTYQAWAERIHPDDYERVQRALADHLEKGVTYDVDYRHRHKSGEYRWQHSKGKAFFDEGGRPTKMVVSVSDITERKQIEAELKRRAAEIELKNRLLEQSDRNKSEFLARMSRELRRPLEAIIGYAALLRRTPPGADGRASGFAADIEASGREMLALVNDILELAKIESGKTELQPAPADVADLARDVVAARPDAATPSEDDVCSGDLRLAPDSASSGHHA
jgi:PAS domain S-box-containing protein